MGSDQRTSMRLSTSLPMRWQPLAAPPSPEQLCELFDLDPSASIGPELAVLSEKTKSSIANLGDHALRQALTLLDNRIS